MNEERPSAETAREGSGSERSEDDHLAATRRAVIAAALPHIAFDGWSDRTLAHALTRRLELVAGEREAVRRGVALFALPHHACDGARAIWHTADVIWNALGDTSRDFNWYSKRATLSAVYSSALLYWLGDDSPGASATREFIGRRIDNVMQIEDVKARIRGNHFAAAMLKGPQALLDRVRAPGNTPTDMPGSWRRRH